MKTIGPRGLSRDVLILQTAARIFFVFSLWACSVIMACAPLVTQERVSDNVVTMLEGLLKIRIDPIFHYLDSASLIMEYENGDGNILQRNTETHIFIEAEKQVIDKAVMLQLEKTERKFNPDFFRNMKFRALEYGKEEIEGFLYKFYTVVGTPTVDGYLAKKMIEKGYILNCGLFKVYRCIVGNQRSLLKIIYYEDLTHATVPCDSWKECRQLTNKQRYFLQQYGERFKKAFTVYHRKVT